MEQFLLQKDWKLAKDALTKEAAEMGICGFLSDLGNQDNENLFYRYVAQEIRSKIFPLNENDRKTLLASLFLKLQIGNAALQSIAVELFGQEENLGICVSRNMFPMKKKPIHTIALYYHRLSNGGVERLIAKLADFFIEIGYKVILILDESPDKHSYTISNNVRYRVFSSGLQYNITSSQIASRIEEWQKFIQEEKIDLVLNNAWGQSLLIWDFLAVKLTQCNYMVYVHNTCSTGLSWSHIARNTFQGTDGLICLSRVDSVYYQLRGCNPCYIPNMVTIEQPEIRDFKPKNNDIVWIGRFDTIHKQPMDAVKAFALIHKKVPDARLIFVGKGEEGDTIEDDLKAAAKEFGVEKNIVFAGFTTNVAEHLKNAAVFLFTSKYEGFSLVISEAKAYGLPIVSYDLPYMETFRTCEGHILVEQGDYQALAEETIKVLQDPALREEMARKAYESIKYFLNYPYEQKWKEVFAAVEKGEKISSSENSVEDLAIAAKVLVPAYENVILDTQRDIGNLQAEISRLWYYCQEKDTTLTELLKYARLINLVKRILPEGSLRRRIVKAPLKLAWKCLKILRGKR